MSITKIFHRAMAVLLVLGILPASDGWAQATGSAADGDGLEVHGSLRTRYRSRRGIGPGQNEDLFQYLDLRFGELGDQVSGAVYLRANSDFAFRRLPGDPFRGLEDTFDDPQYRLFHGYVDVKDLGPFDKVRSGRQTMHEVPGIYFDGLSFERQTSDRTHLSLYGGQSVHLYEDGSNGDWVLGFGAQHQLTGDLSLRLDMARVRDRLQPYGTALPGNPPLRTEASTLASLSAYYDLSRHVGLDFKAVRLDDAFRTLRLGSMFRYPGQGLFFRVAVERQPDPFGSQPTEFSPFFDALGLRAAYTDLSLQGSKTLMDDLELTFGTTQRDSDQDAGRAVYNQDFSRYYLGLFHSSLLGDDRASLAVNYDRYLADSSEFGTIGGELSYRLDRTFDVTAGSSYSLYEFDPLTLLVRDHVREYYLAADWRLPEDWRVRSRFVVEPFQDGQTFRTLEMSIRHDF